MNRPMRACMVSRRSACAQIHRDMTKPRASRCRLRSMWNGFVYWSKERTRSYVMELPIRQIPGVAKRARSRKRDTALLHSVCAGMVKHDESDRRLAPIR